MQGNEPQDPWNRGVNPQPPQDWHAAPAPPIPVAPSRRDLTPQQMLRLILAWGCIIICTAALFIFQSLGMEAMQEAYADDPRPGYNTLYLARYAVGIENMQQGQGRMLQPEFDQAAFSTPHILEAHIRSIILAGEVDADSIDQRLDEMRNHLVRTSGNGVRDARVVERIYTQQYVPTQDERDRLVEQHGWFGEIAATYNEPIHSDAYRAPRRSSTIMVFAIIAIILTAGLALLVGCGLGITAIVLACTRQLSRGVQTGPAGHRTAYLEATALFLLLFILVQLLLGLIQEWTGVDMLLPTLLICVLPIFWPLVVGVPWQRFKQDMGYHTGRGLFREIGAGLVGYIAGLPIVAVGIGITFLLTLVAEAQADHPMQYELMDGGRYTVLLSLAAAVIWAPLVEESIFRAGFYRHLRQWRGVGGMFLATGVTAFIFAAIHPQGWVGIPVLMSIAFVLSGLREWRGSVIPSMVAHAIHNGAVSLLLGVILFA